MNPGLVVKLRPAGPWRIGPDSGARNRVDVIYHSDSLFSAVSSAMGRMGLLGEWLDATARTAEPAVCFSSCFPFLDEVVFVVPPRTMWPPTSPALMSARVRWKSARFVPLPMVQALLSGEKLNASQWAVDGASGCLVPAGRSGPFRTGVRWNAAVDRLSGASERHATACIEFRPGSGLWTVVGFADDAARDRWQAPVKAAFRLLADTGFGGERSRGWGRAETPEFIEGSLPEMIIEDRAGEVKEAAEPGVPEEPSPVPPLQEPPREEPPVKDPTDPLPAQEPPPDPPAEPPPPDPDPEPSGPPILEPEPVMQASVRAPESLEPMRVNAGSDATEEAPVAGESALENVESGAAAPEASAVTELAPETESQSAPEVHADGAATPEGSAVTEPAPATESQSAPEVQAEGAAAPEASAVTESSPEAESQPVPEVQAEGAAAPEASVVTESAPETESQSAPELPAATAPAPAVPQPGMRPALQAHWMLSLFTPAPADAVDWGRGSYTVLARGGRVDSPSGSGELKKQLQMVAEGSVLYADGVPRGAASDVAPDGFAHPVFRAGFALSIRLPEVH